MIKPTFVRCSISLDIDNRNRARLLAAESATSVSGLIRMLLGDAYRRRQRREAPEFADS